MDLESEGVCVQVWYQEKAIFFIMMMVERRTAAQASAKRERRRAGMSAANVGASCIDFINNYKNLQKSDLQSQYIYDKSIS